MPENSKVYVVAQLYRWERTSVALSIGERIRSFLSGRVSLSPLVDESAGWVPVFDSYKDAHAYVLSSGLPAENIIEATASPQWFT